MRALLALLGLACWVVAAPHELGSTQAFWNSSLTPQQLRRAVVHEGDGVALHKLFVKLASGKPVIVNAIGGSVSTGHGVGRPALIYSRLVFDYIAARFPNPGHRYINGAAAGTGAAYFASCLDAHVAKNADLVLVEFGVNPSPLDGLEGITRRLLRRGLLDPDVPLLVFVQWCDNWPLAQDRNNPTHWPDRAVMWPGPPLEWVYTARDAEPTINTLATYYNFVSISMRSALLHEVLRGVRPYTFADFGNAGDAIHPNAFGHRHMADAVIGLLERSWHHGGAYAALEQPVDPGWLPPPLVKGNDIEHRIFSCNVSNHDAIKLREVMKNAADWRLEEGQKPGLWGNVSGSHADLTVAVPPPIAAEPGSAEALTVFYLKSWHEEMGTVELTCLSPCTCPATVIDGHGGMASVTEVATVQIVAEGECALRLTVQRGAFKLIGLALSRRGGG